MDSTTNNNDSSKEEPQSAPHHLGGIKLRDMTEKEELTDCDREEIHLIGNVQFGAGNVLFVSFPDAKIVAADTEFVSIPWIKRKGGGGKEQLLPKQQVFDISPTSTTVLLDEKNKTTANGNTADCNDTILEEKKKTITNAMLGTLLQTWIPAELYSKIVEAVEEMTKANSQRSFELYSYEGESYAISLSPSGENLDLSIIGVEIESLGPNCDQDGREFFQTLLSLSRIMEFYADQELVTTTCDTVFKLLNSYDRGMVYQFNDDNSGEIIHEIKADHVTTSYKGLRFPAGDIPQSSRELYIKNGLRYIRNANAKDTPIVHRKQQHQQGDKNHRKRNHDDMLHKGEQNNGATHRMPVYDGSSMDLSHIRMRAVSIHHLRYLRNMGVVCSLSVAIVVDNKLWGLLAFHGYQEPFKPSLQQRIACEAIASMLSVKMEALMKKAQSSRIIELSEALARLEQDHSVSSNLQELGKDILRIVNADVLVGRIQDPTKEGFQTIIIGDKTIAPGETFWTEFSKQPKREILAVTTRAGIEKLGVNLEDCQAGGIAYYQDGLIQIMLGRGLRSKNVAWGGNPDEPKVRKDGILCPRGSFDKFMEKARREARAWSKADLHLIATFAERLSDHSHNRMISLLKHDIEEANTKYFNAIERARDNCEFFAQMSHEIRTPFHGVMGCLNLLHDAKNMPEEEIQDMVNTALTSGNHMINLLNDILDISKNMYSASIVHEKVNYQTLTQGAIQGLKSLALNNGITINTDVVSRTPESCVILTDRTKVIQVVSNIINNAIKFAPNGTIDIRIRLPETIQEAVAEWERDVSKYEGAIFAVQEHDIFSTIDSVKRHVASTPTTVEKKWMLVAIEDSGCGMKQGELAEMLKPYTQSSNGSNRSFQGTGLGLFICLSLCQQLNGFIACASTKGVGSTFHIGIPVGVPDAEIESKEEEKEKVPDTSPWMSDSASRIKIRGPIAVVDDNKVNVKILARTLTNEFKNLEVEHVDIITATGGMAAFKLYKDRRPDLIFIDYHMPEVDGLQATAMIRQYETENGLIPSFIMSYTADATEKTETLLLSRGTDGIMLKPPPRGFLSNFLKRLDFET